MSSRRLAEAFEHMVGAEAPVRFVAYDGSVAGPVDAPVTLDVRSETAIRYIATAHNGQVRVENVPSGGCRFTLEFPTVGEK